MKNFSFVMLDTKNLAEAISLGRAIFPDESDVAYLTRSLTFAASLSGGYVSPGTGRVLQQLPHFLYRAFDSMVGIGGLGRYEDDPVTAWLSWFGVHPQYRKRGIGTEIINHLERLSYELGLHAVALYCDAHDKRAQQFYGTLGFSDCGQSTFNQEIVRIMKKELSEVCI